MSDVTIFVNFVLTLSQMSWSFYKIVFDWFKISHSRIPYLLALLFFCEHTFIKTFFWLTTLRRSMRTSFFARPFPFPNLLSSVKQLRKFICGCTARQIPSQLDLTWKLLYLLSFHSVLNQVALNVRCITRIWRFSRIQLYLDLKSLMRRFQNGLVF